MNTAVKTYWKLAYRSVKKALLVTVQSFSAAMRAARYTAIMQSRLSAKKRELDDIEFEANSKLFNEEN